MTENATYFVFGPVPIVPTIPLLLPISAAVLMLKPPGQFIKSSNPVGLAAVQGYIFAIFAIWGN